MANRERRLPSVTVQDETLHSQSIQLLMLVCFICGIILWFGSEIYDMIWPVKRLSLCMVLCPFIIIILHEKLQGFIGFAVMMILSLLIWQVWLATKDNRSLILLTVPICSTMLLISPLWGVVSGLICTFFMLWKMPLWSEETMLWGIVSLLVVWLSAALAWSTIRYAVTATEWAESRYSRMRALLEEALDQRVMLKDTRDDLVQANAELERLAKRLALMTQVAEEASQTKERFLANVSHELRTPLNMIIGFSEIITQSPEVYGAEIPGALLADISAIQRNSRHLASLVDDILDLSHTEAGELALMREWANVTQVVREATGAVGALFETKGLYLRVSAEGDLPAAYCDRTRIRQVVLNLLSNAGRFTTQGGVDIVLARRQSDILCSVSDTGTGIAGEDIERVFEPFFQSGDTMRRRGDGSGLGLSISRSIVELHGGTMGVESKLGEGTTFFFTLPVVATSGEKAPLSRWFSAYNEYVPRDRQALVPYSQPKPRLVVLEAGTALAKTLRRHAGHAEVQAVHSLAEARAELESTPAEALIVNTDLSESISGVVAEFEHLPNRTPAAICWLPADEEVAAQLGVKRYLLKPIKRTELLKCLDQRGDSLHTILLVDDDAEALQMMARTILGMQRPYEVLRAGHAERALDLMREKRPDLVLLDMYLPGMSGFDLLRIKAGDPAIAEIDVIAVSAHDPMLSLSRGNSLTLVHHRPLSVKGLLEGVGLLSGIDFIEGAPRPEHLETGHG